MGHDDIGARCCHLFCLAGIERIGGCEQIFFPGQADQFHFLVVAHAGFFQIGAELTIDQSYGRKILDSCKADTFHLIKELVDYPEGVRRADTGQYRGILDDSQYLTGHFDYDLVGIAVGHQASQRASSCHAKSSRVVDDD